MKIKIIKVRDRYVKLTPLSADAGLCTGCVLRDETLKDAAQGKLLSCAIAVQISKDKGSPHCTQLLGYIYKEVDSLYGALKEVESYGDNTGR
jgi:pyruvoyl-dependent arginine decarboxylase (PvlArgDC)